MDRKLTIFVVLFFLFPRIAGAQEKEPAEQLKSLMESCQFSQAISLAELYLAKDSIRPDLLLLKGRALAAVFRYKEAIAALRKAQRLDSTNIKVLNELVNVYRTVDPDKAIETGRKITSLDPGNRYFSLQLANLYYSDKDYMQALQVLSSLYRDDSSDFYVVKQMANSHDELKQSDSAMFFYRKALKIVPYDPIVTGKLTNILIREDEINAAFYLTAIYLKQDPVNIPILKQNAYCNYLILDFPASAKQFRKCLKLGDSTKFTRKYLGLSYYKQDKYDSAAPFFLAAFRSDTNDAEVCFYYGVSETRSLAIDTGLIYLQRTLRLLMPSPSFLSMIYTELAGAYTGIAHPDTAIVLLQKALEVNPQNDITLFKIAYQYDYYLRKPNKALPYYKEFLKNLPPQPEHDPREAFYGKAVVKNGIREINVSYSDYAKNRIMEISRARKKADTKK
jgi:tetratricopeptide (TPR) repeat protein